MLPLLNEAKPSKDLKDVILIVGVLYLVSMSVYQIHKIKETKSNLELNQLKAEEFRLRGVTLGR